MDWLRVAAIAGVFVYHTFRPFDATDWHVKNAETNALLGGVQIFVASFGLAVLFLLAGAGVQFALRKRSWGTFLRERAARLAVPFVVGTILLSPIQAFIESAHDGAAVDPLPDFVGWWAAAVDRIVHSEVTPAILGLGYHLWFLGFLFLISVACLPICAALRSPRGRAALASLAARMSAVPGSTLAFALPMIVLISAFAPLGTSEHDWAEFGWYSAYFMTGFVLLADDRFLVALRRDLPIAGVAALVSTAALVVLDFGSWFADETQRADFGRTLVLVVVWMVEGWAWTIVVLNLGLRLRPLQRPVNTRAAEAVLPVYVIHQPVILAVALVVVELPLGIAPKWLLVFGASLAITLALVELALRSRFARVLLGARPAQVATGHGLRAAGPLRPRGGPTLGAPDARAG